MDNHKSRSISLFPGRVIQRSKAFIGFLLWIGAATLAAAGLMFTPYSGYNSRNSWITRVKRDMEPGIKRDPYPIYPTVKRIERQLAALRRLVEDNIDKLQ